VGSLNWFAESLLVKPNRVDSNFGARSFLSTTLSKRRSDVVCTRESNALTLFSCSAYQISHCPAKYGLNTDGRRSNGGFSCQWHLSQHHTDTRRQHQQHISTERYNIYLPTDKGRLVFSVQRLEPLLTYGLKLFKRDDPKDNANRNPAHILSLDFDDVGELLMTSESDETIQIYNVKEGRYEKSSASKKYGVKLAKFTHASSSIIYASTKANGTSHRKEASKPAAY
jgi:WD40 repeat protein